jgi:ABC-type antimicrobial peptide transport system permease subunit
MVVGVIATVMLARFVSSRLYGVSPTDPWTIAGAIAVLTGVACIAALIPARHAATIDPSAALRCD